MLDIDNDVRGAIVRALIASINNEVSAIQPSNEELMEYYHSNQERFTYPGAIAVKVWTAEAKKEALLLQEAIQNNQVIFKRNGVRPLKRAIQRLFEDPISELIIDSKIVKGETINVSVTKDKKQLLFKHKK